MAEELKFPALNLRAPRKPLQDPLNYKIMEELERYMEGELMPDHQKREIIAAFLSGMMFALDIVIPKKGGVVLPVFLRRKVIEFAQTLGMQAIGSAAPAPVPVPAAPTPKPPEPPCPSPSATT